MSARVGCAVLAAGCSARLGRPKQLEVVGTTTLVRRAVSAARDSICDEVVALVGAYAPLVEAELAGLCPHIVVTQWRDGMGASIRAAARWSMAQEHDALVLAVCDQPLLTHAPLDALVVAWRDSSQDRAVASAYSDVIGVPALFPRSRFERLAALDPARGASALLRSDATVIAIAWPQGAVDVDTEADLERLHARGASLEETTGPGGSPHEQDGR